MNAPQIIPGQARSCLLVDFSVSSYDGAIKDNRTQEDVATRASASARATSVRKNLFAECKELEAIKKFVANVRTAKHYPATMPWSDTGTRLLVAARMPQYVAMMGEAKETFFQLVDEFLVKYDSLIAAQAFTNGALFDRSEYLTREQVRRRFAWHFTLSPLPVSGDFRLDIENETQRELVRHYEQAFQERVAAAVRDPWTRLHKVLARISTQLTPNEDGTRKKLYDSMLDNAQELIDTLADFNITNDPNLEAARTALARSLVGVDIDELKKQPDLRATVKEQVDAIIKTYDWEDDE